MSFFSSRLHRSLSMLWLVTTLSACAYLIPEDPNAPRHNLVAGERKRPQLNQPNAAVPINRPEAMAAMPETMVPMETPRAPEPVPVAQAPLSPMAGDSPLPSPMTGRSVPVENLDTPALNSVPPRPVTSGAQGAEVRMEETRVDLEAERTQAMQARRQLANDVVAEQSALYPPVESSSVLPPLPDMGAPAAPVLPPAETVGSASLPPVLGAPPPDMTMPMPAPTVVNGAFDPSAVASSTTPFSGSTAMHSTGSGNVLPASRYSRRR